MFVVAGVTGNTGSVVASTLLAHGKPVRVVVRDEKKALPWREKGADVAVASLDDASALSTALQGATGAYLLIPPDPTSEEFLARGRRFADAMTAALHQVAVPHVVYLSSIAAHQETGTGPIRTHHYGEQKIRSATRTTFTFLRPGYFMENLALLLGAVRGQGVLPAFFSPQTPIDMIATHDIGEIAVRALLDPPGQTQILELTGPTRYHFEDAARAFATALGKPVQAVQVPVEGIVPALRQAGLSHDMADLYREMSVGIDTGTFGFEGGSARLVQGATTLETFVKTLV